LPFGQHPVLVLDYTILDLLRTLCVRQGTIAQCQPLGGVRLLGDQWYKILQSTAVQIVSLLVVALLIVRARLGDQINGLLQGVLRGKRLEIEEGMRKEVDERNACRGLVSQKAAQEIVALVADASVWWQCYGLGLPDSQQQLLNGSRTVRRLAEQTFVQDHPDAPEIRLGIVLMLAHNLRGHVEGRALQLLIDFAQLQVLSKPIRYNKLLIYGMYIQGLLVLGTQSLPPLGTHCWLPG